MGARSTGAVFGSPSIAAKAGARASSPTMHATALAIEDDAAESAAVHHLRKR
jgi:hypothetical protein